MEGEKRFEAPTEDDVNLPLPEDLQAIWGKPARGPKMSLETKQVLDTAETKGVVCIRNRWEFHRVSKNAKKAGLRLKVRVRCKYPNLWAVKMGEPM